MPSRLFNQQQQIQELYDKGFSCSEIKDILNIFITVRSIQRFIKSHGRVRSRIEAYQLAKPKMINNMRKYWKGYVKLNRTMLNRKTRYSILKRDNFKCVLCGRGAPEGAKLQVDHIIAEVVKHNTDHSNLRTLCFECNTGRNYVDYNVRRR